MSDNEQRPSTPPPRRTDLFELQATPEHVKQIEINRLKGQQLLIHQLVPLLKII